MNSKDIRFAKEYSFNVRCENSLVELKLNEVYEYQIVADSLMIGNESDFVPVEILNVKSAVFHELKKYRGRSLLRLDKVDEKTGVYVFNLLAFYQHTHFEEPYQVIIDAAIYPELRRRGMDKKAAVKYLTEELVFKEQYWFAYGSEHGNNEQRLCGRKIFATIKPSAQGYLHITEIRDNKNTSSAENLITLMSGKIEFKDDTEQLQRITKEFMEKYNQATRDNAELINLWRIYNELDQEAIKSDAVEMGFIKYKRYRRSCGNLIFNVDGGYVFSDFLRSDMQYVVIAQDSFNQDDPLSYNPKTAINIGSEFDKNCVNTNEFSISEDYIDAFKKLPDKGYIVPSLGGSVTQSRRRDTARKRILNGKNPLLGLNLLLQSGDIVGVVGKERAAITDHLRKYIFGESREKDFNDRQKDAIRIAVNTPDIALIQGPPGTGKTQVIRAIVERINELENGEARILITSTQHDAVDNAIKGVSYGGVPVNRVINSRRVSAEDAAAFRWIDEMIASCGDWLSNHPIQGSTQELFVCLAGLQSDNGEMVVEKLKHLYHLLQVYSYSGELLARVNETIINMIAESESDSGDDKHSRLAELLNEQRTDAQSFWEDGVQRLALLERYLKYDCDDVEFEIPVYWKQLIRANTETTEFENLLLSFKLDVEKLKIEVTSSSGATNTEKFSKQSIVALVQAVQEEMAGRCEEMTAEQKLRNQIWQFKHELSNIENVKNLIADYSQVNAATCQQAANKFLSPSMHGFDDQYDYVIIDEAARSNPLDLLIPMSMGRKVILVGDHKQLPHMVEKDVVQAVVAKTKDDTATQVLEESLFRRLFNKVHEADERAKIDVDRPIRIARTCTLNEQFRMHSVICELINVFYEDEKLKTACSDADKQHNLNLYNNKPLAWIDVPASEKQLVEARGISKSRPCEVEIVRSELSKILLANTIFDIGIITFYRKQAELLKHMVEEEFPSDRHRISVGTVDAFQGKEFDIVILSTVRSNKECELNRRVGFLNNNNRLCVAFSRAKRLLLTVGDSATVANDGKTTIIESLNELYKRSKQEDIGYYETL